jgi:hypothetical protein
MFINEHKKNIRKQKGRTKTLITVFLLYFFYYFFFQNFKIDVIRTGSFDLMYMMYQTCIRFI